jgi:3-methylcrotonyl-CoA carboxylase beta subunit
MLFTWPNARISVMGGKQAAHVLATVQRESKNARGNSWLESEEKEFMDVIRNQYESEGHPYFASARIWDDGVIDPIETRHVLGMALWSANQETFGNLSSFGVFRM